MKQYRDARRTLRRMQDREPRLAALINTLAEQASNTTDGVELDRIVEQAEQASRDLEQLRSEIAALLAAGVTPEADRPVPGKAIIQIACELRQLQRDRDFLRDERDLQHNKLLLGRTTRRYNGMWDRRAEWEKANKQRLETSRAMRDQQDAAFVHRTAVVAADGAIRYGLAPVAAPGAKVLDNRVPAPIRVVRPEDIVAPVIQRRTIARPVAATADRELAQCRAALARTGLTAFIEDVQ